MTGNDRYGEGSRHKEPIAPRTVRTQAYDDGETFTGEEIDRLLVQLEAELGKPGIARG